MTDDSRALTRDDWIAAAMERLRTQGIGGVRILPLAKALGVTRGSFYWHFHDRQDLLDHMLDWWDRQMTDSVIQHSERADQGVRLTSLAEFILRNDLNRFDAAIRTWANGDGKAATVQKRVLKKRLEYVTGQFRQAGFTKVEATARGHLLAVYIMSEGVIHMGESLETRLRLLRRQIKMLLKPE